jgi:DNA-binding FadR family transcriptional regulator
LTHRSPADGNRANGPRKAKRAEQVAMQLEAEIIERGWPVGEVLGSEAELIERYGVSRSAFREAVRIVEHHQVARMRRGPGGGLVVTVPELTSVLRPALLYLTHTQARVGDLWSLRRAIELETVRIAVDRLDQTKIQHLRDVAEAESHPDGPEWNPLVNRGFHVMLAEVTENPAVILFTELLMNLAYARPTSRLTPAQLERLVIDARQHMDIVEAIVAGDAALAQHRMGVHLDHVEQLLESDYPVVPAPHA